MPIKYCDALILYREELLLVTSIMDVSKRLPSDVLKMSPAFHYVTSIRRKENVVKRLAGSA